jgi:hypothetical protein
VKICEDLFGIQKNSIVEHFKFNRFQKEGESSGDFALELQACAEFCDFGGFLDIALRDRFAAGIRNNRTKKVLLRLSRNKKFNEVVAAAKREECHARRELQRCSVIITIGGSGKISILFQVDAIVVVSLGTGLVNVKETLVSRTMGVYQCHRSRLKHACCRMRVRMLSTRRWED